MRFIKNFIYSILNLIQCNQIHIYIANINVQHDDEYLLKKKAKLCTAVSYISN